MVLGDLALLKTSFQLFGCCVENDTMHAATKTICPPWNFYCMSKWSNSGDARFRVFSYLNREDFARFRIKCLHFAIPMAFLNQDYAKSVKLYRKAAEQGRECADRGCPFFRRAVTRWSRIQTKPQASVGWTDVFASPRPRVCVSCPYWILWPVTVESPQRRSKQSTQCFIGNSAKT